ncbi:MAG: cell division protein FtsL [Magnetococcales bacterium]|nr:cell division protein FtsL [Magnetococcales bacterium]MBF0261160.1 cell division protein FtsL [Magnetococcales bacterium]
MKSPWILHTLLTILLVITAAITIASRMWMQEAHRELENHLKKRVQLLDQEQALRVEWVARTDLNTIERRAKKDLGMRPMRPDQWREAPE